MTISEKEIMTSENKKDITRIVLGAGLLFAGISHLTFARREFKAQVPDWVPLKKDDTVVYSGIAEIALGGALVLAPQRHESTLGKIAAAFFIADFPAISRNTRTRETALD